MELRIGYTLLFALAAVSCFVAAYRASRITDEDVERGLVSLLLFSGAWATASTGRLVVADDSIQITFYIVGLVVGLGTVGAWLYFCSAYAGYRYHRQTSVRQVALLAYVLVSGVKLTNPLHSLYFSTSSTETVLGRVAIELSTLHWVVTGLAYSLTAVGFYMLYEVFRESHFDTTKLGALVSLTALPAVVDILAFSNIGPPVLVPLNYEPIGVAIFALGVLYVVDETFIAVPRTWRKEVVEQFRDPVVLVDSEDRIRDFNGVSTEVFPGLADARGSPLGVAAPPLMRGIENPDDILEVDRNGTRRFYAVQATPLSNGTTTVGRVAVYKDVTDLERHRRELQRQNDQLSEFSTALNHELRNAITVVQGFIDIVAERTDTERAANEAGIARANTAVSRMRRVISDLTTLARYGQTPETVTDCHIREVVGTVWERSDFGDLSYTLKTDGVVRANEPRLETLFRDYFRFALANGATHVSIELSDETLYLTGDGDPLSAAEIAEAFEFGPPVPAGDVEMTLPNIRLLAEVHEWTAEIYRSYTAGVRISINGVTVPE